MQQEYAETFYSKKFLMQLPTSLLGNVSFLKIFFKWMTFVWNLEKSETIENVRNNKVKNQTNFVMVLNENIEIRI